MELFPTPLIMTKIEENTDELKLSHKFTRNDNDQKYNHVKHKDGKRILEDYPRIRDSLLEKFVAVADEYLQYKNKEYIITTSWITHSQKGDKSTLHKHLNSFWSGVYYFQDNYPKGTAEILFNNPNQQLSSISFTTDDVRHLNNVNCGSLLIKPESKVLLLFPSYLYHRVMYQIIDAERLSLAFNIMPITEWGGGDSYFNMDWVRRNNLDKVK